MNIVIIDSGVESRYNAEIKHRIHFTLDHSNAIIGNEATDDKVGHGTFVYRLVKQYCNEDISIIKILNEENQCNYNVLLYALRYSLEIGAKVVICIFFGHVCNSFLGGFIQTVCISYGINADIAIQMPRMADIRKSCCACVVA